MNGSFKERPILFSAPMVQAILDGRKTQTRRVLKVQPPGDGYQLLRVVDTSGPKSHVGKLHWGKLSENKLRVLHSEDRHFDCPYGQPGDQLWVREAWRSYPMAGKDGSPGIIYRQTPQHSHLGPWKPSIHMPRWASRIQLEIVSVRVDRLNDISEEDARSEGVLQVKSDGYQDYSGIGGYWGSAINSFESLWESINGPGSWSANPWVWVVEFKRVN